MSSSTTTAPIHHYLGDDATFAADASSRDVRMDGAPLPGVYSSLGFEFYLFDNSGTAWTNDFLPKAPPQLAAFPSAHRFELSASQNQMWTFNLIGTVTNIDVSYHPTLAIRHGAGNNAVLAWPLAANGFTLESNTNLAGTNWQSVLTPVTDAVAEHTVTVPSADPHRFYRLKNP